MNITAFILLLFGLQVICLIIGTKSSKGLKSQDDYFLAGKKIRFFPLMMTFIATQVGGGLVLGSAEEAYRYGWSVLLYPLGASLGLIFLSLGIGRKLAQFNVSTIAQIFEVAYNSSTLKKIASCLSILTLFMIFVAQIIASKKFMLSVGVENPLWFFVFWGIVIFYTAVGGLKAVVATDVVQASFFIGAFILCMGYILFTVEFPVLKMQQESMGFDSSKMFGWLFMPFLFMMIEQDMAQRCFAAESSRTVSKAAWCAALCTLSICSIPVFFGVFANQTGIEVPTGSSVLMAAIEQTTTPFLTAIVGCAILAAIISTADSLINAISSNLSQDFKFATNIRSSQLIAAGIAFLGIFFSFFFNNIVDLLILSYELSVGCLFVPIFAALFKKQGNVLSAVLSIICGAIGFLLFKLIPVQLPGELLSVVLSLTGFALGELIQDRRAYASS